jgi:hypothetical protein
MSLFRMQTFAFSAVCLFTPLTYSQNNLNHTKAICEADSLSPREAVGRNNWAYNCGYIGFRHWRWNKFEGHQLKTAPSYPVFSRGTAETVFSAPTNANNECEMASFHLYRDVTMCPSATIDLDKACQQSRKKALKQNLITKETFSQWSTNHQAVVFDEDGNINSIVSCQSYPMLNELMLFQKEQ